MSSEITPVRGVEQGESKIFLPPNVQLNLLYVRHENAADFGDRQEFRTLVRKHDIYVPEAPGWNEDELRIRQRLSNGDSNLYMGIRDFYYAEKDTSLLLLEAESIYASRIKIALADIDEESPIRAQLSKLYGATVEDVIGNSYEETLENSLRHSREVVLLQRLRDIEILNNLGPKLSETINPNPTLSKKKPVKVLMTIGAQHEFIGKSLSEIITPNEDGLPSIRIEEKPGAKWDFTALALYKSLDPDNSAPESEMRRLLEENLAFLLIEAHIAYIYGEDIIPPSEKTFTLVQSLTQSQMKELIESAHVIGGTMVFDKSVSIWQRVKADLL